MTEQNENLVDILAKVETFDDLKATLPKELTEKLGEGEKGIDRTLSLLIGLAPFAPEPATFTRDAFDGVVAFDEESNEPLPQEEAQKMVDIALEAGFMKKVEAETERYMSNPQITPLVDRLFEK